MDLSKSIRYLHTLYDKDSGLFRFSLRNMPTLLSTDFAIMSFFLCNENIHSMRNKLIENILKHKADLNNFIDLNFDSKIDRPHKPDYIVNQFTFFTLIALDMIGIRFNSLSFFDNFLDENNLSNWFDSLTWSNFWYESNKIMFWLYFYSYIIKYGNDRDKAKANECINFSFGVLNSKQDKNTGYWGTNLNHNNIVDGCFGSAHIYLFYDYFGREINFKEKIIDNTLTLHTKNGLILSSEGGACEDYDAVEIYFRLMKQTSYRKHDITNQLEKMRKTIARNQEPDGGFPYRISQRQFAFIKQRKEDVYRYSSWEHMEAKLYYSDSWGTYFRLLTLAAIDKLLKLDKHWQKSYDLPCWGYL